MRPRQPHGPAAAPQPAAAAVNSSMNNGTDSIGNSTGAATDGSTGTVTGTDALQPPRPLHTWWRTRTPRERQALQVAGATVGAALLWAVLVAPAWRTLQQAGANRTRLDAQLAEMQALADEAAQWRAAPVVAPEQAGAALNTAVSRLGSKARLALQAERAVVTLQGVSLEELGPWLRELGSGARTRPLELSLTRGATGYSGTLVLALPTRP